MEDISEALKAKFEPINLDDLDFVEAVNDSNYLRLHTKGNDNTSEHYSMLLTPVNAQHLTLSTAFVFDPKNKDQSAGLIVSNSTKDWFKLKLVGHDSSSNKSIQLASSLNATKVDQLIEPIEVSDIDEVSLKISLEDEKILCYYSTKKHQWHKIGKTFTADFLQGQSDETETQVGCYVEDLSGKKLNADFAFLKYKVH